MWHFKSMEKYRISNVRKTAWLACQYFTEDFVCIFMHNQSIIFLPSIGNYVIGLSRLLTVRHGM